MLADDVGLAGGSEQEVGNAFCEGLGVECGVGVELTWAAIVDHGSREGAEGAHGAVEDAVEEFGHVEGVLAGRAVDVRVVGVRDCGGLHLGWVCGGG